MIFADALYNVPIDGQASGLGKTKYANFAIRPEKCRRPSSTRSWPHSVRAPVSARHEIGSVIKPNQKPYSLSIGIDSRTKK
ncbi:hypothetical protein FXV83_35725 [Bradyrhizobium hipponense]|uniref:Uncharacterized protein n=1 Tax=Bradyrhizobium hipponense TaxID=2605638 RepID=A0A5S4YF28_9BRAD|nr:hypothetical protein [Bradyrhizobium hipponense]TYO61895.1 hypothetical protein FXV83_35725 [Bradyrhizobium hipponense]